jgi:hypothetical protein
MIMGGFLKTVGGFAAGPVAGFFQLYWKQIVVAIALVLVYLYWADRTHTIKTQAATIIDLKVKLNTAKAEFKSTIDAQNAQITEFKKKSDAQDARMKAASDKLAEYRRLYNKGVITIVEGPKPKDCQSAIDYLVDGVKDLMWEKTK